MRGDFSFCGVDIADLGMEYAPDLKETYVYKSSKRKIHEQNPDGHDGGYYYGASVQPKEISLRCFFYMKNIDYGILARFEKVFRVGRTGKLVFKRRPWLWYVATVQSVDDSNLTNYMNGLVTINMKCYYPFARCDDIYINDDFDVHYGILESSGLINKTATPSTLIVGEGEELTEPFEFYLYNGGTERCGVMFEMKGSVGIGTTIKNETTGQACRLVALNTEDPDSDAYNKTFVCDSINGKSLIKDSDGNMKLGFLYHDYGFIELEPSFPIRRNVSIATQANSPICYSTEYVDDDVVGKYIRVDNKWKRIEAVRDNYKIIVDSPNAGTKDYVTNIVLMNKLTVTPESDMKITYLNFAYNPAFD